MHDRTSHYNFDEIIDRTGTNCIKFEAFRNSRPALPEGSIPMWIADMDFACPQPILDAMHRRLDRRILGYSALIDPAYGRAVTGWMQRRFGWAANADEIVSSSGIVTAIQQSVAHLTRPGDGVLLFTPTYMPFYSAIVDQGRTPVFCRLQRDADGRYGIDFDAFGRLAEQPGNTLLFLCSPHNPTGRVWTEAELRRIGEICFQNGIFVVSDEIHADLTRVGVRHIPFPALFPGEKRLITCTAPSKAFNIAGNQLANLFIPDETIRVDWRRRSYCGHPSPLSIDAVIAAYNECEDWLDALRAYLDENFRLAADTLAARLPATRYTVPEGTYLMWLDASFTGLDEAALRARVEAAGLCVEYASDFADNADGCMRINIACPRSVLEEALNRLLRALR